MIEMITWNIYHTRNLELGCSSVAEYLPGMQKALRSIPMCLLITSIDVLHRFVALPLSTLTCVFCTRTFKSSHEAE